VTRDAAVRDRGTMSEAELLDWLAEERVDGDYVLVHPRGRVPRTLPRHAGEHSAFMALMTETWSRVQSPDGSHETVPIRRAWTKALLVGCIMRAPKGHSAGLGINT
jgi:hypothetical protein